MNAFVKVCFVAPLIVIAILMCRPSRALRPTPAVGDAARAQERAAVKSPPAPTVRRAPHENPTPSRTMDPPIEPYGEQEAPEETAQREAQRVRLAMVTQQVRSHFEHERRRQGWAARTEDDLMDAMLEAGVSRRALRQLECRQTLCRVTFDLSTSEPLALGALAVHAGDWHWIEAQPESGAISVYVNPTRAPQVHPATDTGPVGP